MKNCKTFYEAQTVSYLKEIIQPLPNPPPIIYYLTTSLEQRVSYKDIQKYIGICFQSVSRMQLLGVKKWCSAKVFFDNK